VRGRRARGCCAVATSYDCAAALIVYAVELGLAEWLGIAALAVALVGIPLTFIVGRRARQRPVLRYGIDFDVLIDPSRGVSNEKLLLQFGGKEIPRVARTYLAFWNARGDTIRGTDIVADDPLRVELSQGDTPLQSRVVFVSRPQIDVETSNEDSSVAITFDFLDEEDGGIIEVLHQGRRPTFAGTIRGATTRTSGRGQLTLDESDIGWMRERPFYRRWLERMKWAGSGARRRRALSAAVMLLVWIGLALFILWDELFREHNPRLVNPAEFDLRSLDGQKEFSEEVEDKGLKDREYVLLAILGIQLFVMTPLMVRNLMGGRASIPRSIVNERCADDLEPEVPSDDRGDGGGRGARDDDPNAALPTS
jgi:hypothetical protein